ncbi:MAG: class II aldolase/adducin family protein [Gemmatimonadaceae bacterium]|jgi:L-fuculose-phosphate aldolase|nr:class II aldolase/adducin family protein [Gemmatimonadaceae bacterium]
MRVDAARRAVVAACRRLDARGLIGGHEGNLSVRLADGSVLVTPAGRAKGELAPRDLLRVVPSELARWCTAQGGRAKGHRTVPSGPRPSSEFSMHALVYAAHADVGAIVHAHPAVATGAAGWPVPLPWNELPEVRVVIGGVTVVPAIEPGTLAVGQAVAAALTGSRAVLLTRHGATTVGATIDEALARMESLEQAARLLVTEAVGQFMQRGTARARRQSP